VTHTYTYIQPTFVNISSRLRGWSMNNNWSSGCEYWRCAKPSGLLRGYTTKRTCQRTFIHDDELWPRLLLLLVMVVDVQYNTDDVSARREHHRPAHSRSTRCSKNVHLFIHCSFYKHWPVFVIFGTQYTEVSCNTTVIHLPTSPVHYLGKVWMALFDFINQC